MTDEFIDIVTQDGKPTGKKALKSEIHAKGFYHNTAHVWLYNENHEILLQQRSVQKVICPGMWDVSVAGHVDAGETLTEGAVRETKEELGLNLHESDLKKIGVFECFQAYDNGIKDNEFHHTFIAKLNAKLQDLTPQIEEVEALKLVTFEEFESLLKESGTNNHFVPTNRAYYQKVLQAIKQETANS
ncbi:NUDIX hydrolase [Mangrovimonas futianensis]|uniref:NUDIX hydrolase n=1 Tax=Mangrovimonas futianensis TaxID=2895523 RepID=UPI001E2F10C0|nr:NUDIX domain-containing protein [Mangrovimonas futianensis]MCF1423055.1 NUDIX domain-containing protein [Mangrovimonas futianensis]